MSKERLKEIKERAIKNAGYYSEKSNPDKIYRKGYLYEVSDFDFEWLIEQAERTIDYDNNLISLEDNKQYVSELIKQNKRYREAIIETKNIIEEAIESLDNNEKVQGLEWAIKRIDEALEGEER